MTGCYTTRDYVKRVMHIEGADRNAVVDAAIDSASRDIERLTRRLSYIPIKATRLYGIGNPNLNGFRLFLDTDLLSVTTLTIGAQDSSPTVVPSTDYYLEPYNDPPYSRIEADLDSTSVLIGGSAPQRNISVVGVWGYQDVTKAAGTLVGGINSSVTTLVCSDASLIGVGDVLLIDSEWVYVTNKSVYDTATNTNGALVSSAATVTVPVQDGTAIRTGETIQVDSELMYVDSITSNNLTVRRAFDGSVLAAHSSGVDVYAMRTLTVERGVNGSTAASHSNGATMVRQIAPTDITKAVNAIAISTITQELASWGRVVGAGDNQREYGGKNLKSYLDELCKDYIRPLLPLRV